MKSMIRNILIATRNRGKVREIRSILVLPEVQLLDLHDIGFESSIEETGISFEENALIKAAAVYERYEVPVIADDSGLVVPFLNGEPGVYSARWSGADATDERNNKLLIDRLQGAGCEERRAYFTCVAVFLPERGTYVTAEGRVHGYIAHRPEGSNGFGYDPLFMLPSLGKTMAQLTDSQKNRVSHRFRAFAQLRDCILDYVARDGN
jgi:XTP/dITP diphosphohydrolase